MERQTLVFVTERETKNTVRFQEETQRASRLWLSVRCMYSAGRLGNPCRSGLTVTIEAASAYVTP